MRVINAVRLVAALRLRMNLKGDILRSPLKIISVLAVCHMLKGGIVRSLLLREVFLRRYKAKRAQWPSRTNLFWVARAWVWVMWPMRCTFGSIR